MPKEGVCALHAKNQGTDLIKSSVIESPDGESEPS